MNGFDPSPDVNRQPAASVWWVLATAGATAIVLLAIFAFRADTGSATASLASFDSCDELLDQANEARARMDDMIVAVSDDAAAESSADAAGSADSPAVVEAGGSNEAGTNAQESGVDEPDWVKVAGDTLAVLEENALVLVDVTDPAHPAEVGREAIGSGLSGGPGDFAGDYPGTEMLVHENRLIVTRNGYSETGSRAMVLELDISDRSDPELVRSTDFDGYITSSRLSGSTMRIVLDTYPDYSSAREGASPQEWMPSYSTTDANGRVSTGPVVGCSDVSHPPEVTSPGLTVIATIDMSRGLPAVTSEAVMGGSGQVYASPDALYVITGTFDPGAAEFFGSGDQVRTRIHRFDASVEGETTYTGSGEVPGQMRDRWSMSDHNGYLRVATTTTSDGGRTDNRVTVLDTDGPELEEVGRVEGLGPGERIYAVRYFGDYAFVVTFRETDPLYALDLSDPTGPVTRGELKIPGFSSYLHPVGDDLLLGVGQDADENGRTKGVQVSLFDVSDLDDPRRIDSLRLTGRSSGSAVAWDSRSFAYSPGHRLAAIPTFDWANSVDTNVVVSVDPDSGTLGEATRFDVTSGEMTRNIFLGENLITVNPDQLTSRVLDTFEATGALVREG